MSKPTYKETQEAYAKQVVRGVEPYWQVQKIELDFSKWNVGAVANLKRYVR